MPMVVLVHAGEKEEHFGLRPLDPMTDLAKVADLIEEAFAQDLDRAGQNALRELRWLSRLKPLLWWTVRFSPPHTDFLSGFVWEENGKIVGNITVNRNTPTSRRWLISNLAVAGPYRRQGIARGLMYAGIELAREYYATSISLQVRADNEAARRLYQTLNFKQIGGTTSLRLRRRPARQPTHPLPGAARLRSRQANLADTRRAYELALAATPQEAQKEWPVRRSRFQLGLAEQLGNMIRRLIGGGPLAYWCVEENSRFVAAVEIYPGIIGRAHRIEMMVHPEWRGRLEKPLLNRALNFLARQGRREIRVKQPVYHPEAIEAYRELGFQEEQTLLWMKREL